MEERLVEADLLSALAEAFESVQQRSADACIHRSRPHSCRFLGGSSCSFASGTVSAADSRSTPPSFDLRRQLAHLRGVIRRELDTFRLQEKVRLFAEGPRRRGLEIWCAICKWFRGAALHLPPLSTGSAEPATIPQERAACFANHLQQALSGTQDPAFDHLFFNEVEESVRTDP